MNAIAAMSENRVIGKNNAIPWKLRDDMRWFKQFTMGKSVVFGRVTYDTMPPLPGRKVHVLTTGEALITSLTLKDANDVIVRDISRLPKDIVVAGGAKVYNQLLPFCNELYLTIVEGEYEGDAFMPRFEHLFPAYEVVKSGEGYRILRYFQVNSTFPQANC